MTGVQTCALPIWVTHVCPVFYSYCERQGLPTGNWKKAKFPQDSTKRQQKDIKKMSDSFVIQRGVLYKLGPRDRLLLAIPANQRSDLLFSVHDSLTAIHPGKTKTMLKMYDQYWFPHMARTVRDYISRCGSCQRKKNPKVPVRMPLKNQYAEYPFHVLAVDFQGPLTQTKSGNKHILVWTDHFTKWTEMEATMDQLASTVAKSYINRIFCRFGAPKVLISDRAKNFLSDIVAEINKLMGVDHRKTTPYHPQTNGACEIRNKSIGNMLSHIVNERMTGMTTWVLFNWHTTPLVIRWSMPRHTCC